jgi:hypothetical protein
MLGLIVQPTGSASDTVPCDRVVEQVSDAYAAFFITADVPSRIAIRSAVRKSAVWGEREDDEVFYGFRLLELDAEVVTSEIRDDDEEDRSEQYGGEEIDGELNQGAGFPLGDDSPLQLKKIALPLPDREVLRRLVSQKMRDLQILQDEVRVLQSCLHLIGG